MKKIFIILVALLVSYGVFSQKTIDKPDYGFSNLPGKLSKIERTDSATILHFYIQYPPGQWIFIPKESFIQDVNGGEKIYLTKSEGIPTGERYIIPSSGEVSYQLYFPKLSNTINKVDFGEANEGGNWSVYDIVLQEGKEVSLLPKILQGSWLKTDGSNQWDYGFYSNLAVVDQAVWNYKTVEMKKNNYTIVLENAGKEKTIYAQIDRKGTVMLGENKEKLAIYSTEKVDNPNYKFDNDEVYSDIVFKTDSATYSGFIKGYSPRVGKKTGNIYVNNVLTGNQDSHLVKITDDGSFSVKFPVHHPQSIYVDILGNRSSVFVEPGKETFQLIDRNAALFMGDCARVNTDFNSLESISYSDYQRLRTKIHEMSPEAFKQACLDIKLKQFQDLDAIIKKQFVSQKALQIKKLNIELLAFEQILSYEMYKEDFERSKLPVSEQAKPYQLNFKLDKSYYDFITPSVLNNELAVISDNYSSFINRLQFARVLRPEPFRVSYTFLSETIEELQKSGIVLSDKEKDLASVSKQNDALIYKSVNFFVNNFSEIQKFKSKYSDVGVKLQKENSNVEVSVGKLADRLQAQGVVFTADEKKLITDFKASELTKEELAITKKYHEKYGEIQKSFREKYNDNIQSIDEAKESNRQDVKLKTFFGTSEAFVFDIFKLQQKSGQITRNYSFFTDHQLQSIQKDIKHPFLSNYIVYENNKMKAVLEANKSKSGFAVNTVKKTEGDELFDSMIAKFKGKVIYVDFWATWCGPCIQGIKEIASLKEEMKDQEVVFLYITGETSPLKTWENSIPNIKGEHYRVSEDEWNYLSQKFNISGIPHYVLVNKKGEVVNPKLGHHSNEGLKKILEKEM
ncbi:TlpA family protein disulfide reductase [Flavobacterium magnesitis]|uniref:TlpA family protein disulfide reductase n=1 Tax=Flavobacterium magnesitis TaxID=3138077 RepID=UPI00358DEA94